MSTATDSGEAWLAAASAKELGRENWNTRCDPWHTAYRGLADRSMAEVERKLLVGFHVLEKSIASCLRA